MSEKVNFRFIVDKVPKTPSECPYVKFHPYPPFVEEPGFYECGFAGGMCETNGHVCHHLKEADYNKNEKG